MRYCFPRLVAATILCSMVQPASAGPILTVSDPTHSGDVGVALTFDRMGIEDTNLFIDAETAEEKRNLIRQHLLVSGKNQFFPVARGTNQIEIISVMLGVRITSIRITFDRTGELNDDIDSNTDDVDVAEVTFGNGPFSATDATGNENSSFQLGIVSQDPVTGFPILVIASATSDMILASQGDLTGSSVATELAAEMKLRSKSSKIAAPPFLTRPF